MSSELDYEINKELGECYLFMGDLDKADAYYRKALVGDNAQTAPFIGLATIAMQKDNLEDALVLYRKAALIQACDKSLTGIGMILLEKGDYDEAFSNLTKALEHNPQNIIALNCLVRVGYALENLERLLPYFENALELDPSQNALRFSLAGVLISLGRKSDATVYLEEILNAEPENEEAKELYEAIA